MSLIWTNFQSKTDFPYKPLWWKATRIFINKFALEFSNKPKENVLKNLLETGNFSTLFDIFTECKYWKIIYIYIIFKHPIKSV